MARAPIPFMETKSTDGKVTGQAFLMPAKEGTCEVCATAHEPDQPHNAQSLFYGMRFKLEHGRDADWRDAMAHCSPEVKRIWTDALKGMGVDVEAGQINPPKARGRK